MNKLYVGNLPYKTDENELVRLFGECGAVIQATVIRDRTSGRSKGFGFVEMSSEEDARKAITEMNGKTIEGRALTVNEAREPVKKGGREDFDRGHHGGHGDEVRGAWEERMMEW